jgi:uncharacterized protein (DUF2336 family)
MTAAPKTAPQESGSGSDADDDPLRLLELARDKSQGSRNRLVEALGEIFYDDAHQLNDAERGHATEILRRLMRDVEKTVRRALAERIAKDPEAPRDLVVQLANDEIEVAHPILVLSEILGDDELLEIVRGRSMEHRLAIAMRKSLSEEVSEAIVDTGDAGVIRVLLENEGARLSPETLEELVEASRDEPVYQEPLASRKDLNERLARRMYWWVSAALRKHIAKNFEIDSNELDSNIVSAVKGILGDGSETAIDSADDAASCLAEKGAITPQLMIQTLREGQMSLFEAIFARHVGLDRPMIKRFIAEPGGEGLAIAAKACGMYKPDFASIFLLSRAGRPGEKVVDPAELSRVVEFFDRIKTETAKKVVAYWKLDPDYLTALKQVEAEKRKERIDNPG